jgi:hypothetical protein
MTRDISLPSVHPTGEAPKLAGGSLPQGVSLDSFAGPVHVEWDSEAALTPLGQLPFFILKTAVGFKSAGLVLDFSGFDRINRALGEAANASGGP